MHKLMLRAWDKKNKFWLDPEHFYITGEGRGFTCEDSKGMFSTVYRYMGTDRYTIEEYTGFTDKNGKEIYEGDIIKARLNTDTQYWFANFLVDWSEEAQAIRIYKQGQKLDVNCIRNYKDVEVIGNIHENPKLLETERKENNA